MTKIQRLLTAPKASIYSIGRAHYRSHPTCKIPFPNAHATHSRVAPGCHIRIAIQPREIARQPTRKHFHTSSALTMSDAAYESFLNKANQDTSGEEATAQSKSYGTKSVNTAVPKALESVQEYYTSDADEPFEPVALEFDGDKLSAGDLKKLLGHGEGVEELSVKGWDPQGQYKKVVDAVKKAAEGEVKVFKVDLEGTRTEYYVVGVSGGKVVGLKALSVES